MLPRHPRRSALREAAARLRRGEVIAYPTEGVWGLGCDPRQRRAFRRILAIKGRSRDKGVLLVAKNPTQAAYYWDTGVPLPVDLNSHWPGTTLVLPARPNCPAWVRGQHAGIAIRVSRHPAVTQLCAHFGGAIVSTSANPSGRAAARSLATLRRYFGPRLWALPARLGAARRPSRIIDARNGRILRS